MGQQQKYETTDNAFIAADKVAVAPQVDGDVAQVLVEDNQRVAAGQVVARLDAASLQAKLAQAIANAAALDAAVRGVDDKSALETAMIAQKAAGVEAAHAQALMATAELNRYGVLARQGWVSSQRAQSAKAAACMPPRKSPRPRLPSRRNAGRRNPGSARAQTFAQAQAAHAAVDSARIEVSRTEIRAPVAGVVGAKAVRPGQYVRPGTNLMSIVPLGQAYVVANFKETQVSRLRIGQPVEIRADAFGRQTIRGDRLLCARHGFGIRPDPGGERRRKLHQDRPAPAGEDRRRPQGAPGRGAAARPVGGGEGRCPQGHGVRASPTPRPPPNSPAAASRANPPWPTPQPSRRPRPRAVI